MIDLFFDLVPPVVQVLPSLLALWDRRAALLPRRRVIPHRSAPPAVYEIRPPRGECGVLLPAGSVAAGLLGGMPPGAVLRYEAPDGAVITCWSAPAAPGTGGGAVGGTGRDGLRLW
ncbi:hypothetical protein ABT160_42335 [Streptomyces sp. NPDC001941]|uniref:hypothetical protein n=1 Tax=Streptomyces sp. NPDC001941 TaxID=3154659 RepID=UPI003323F539